MRIGFGPFGMRDMDRAIEAGRYHVVDGNRELAWSHLVWLMAAGGRDILEGHHAAKDERSVVEAVMRVMGVDHDEAHAATSGKPPVAPALPIDFGFEMSSADESAED
jgi:hypothetical protein